MGLALGRDNGDYFGVSYSLWAAILELAERWGWRPAGTDPPQSHDDGSWHGSYYSSDGQRCKAEDAQRLAEALNCFLCGEPPLPSVPRDDEERQQLRKFVTAAEKNLGAPLCHPVGKAGSWLASEEGREFLGTFVRFCLGGEFELW
jgi:hypothetical protein